MSNRDEYIRQLEAELDSIDAGMSTIEMRIRKSSEAAQRELNAMHGQREQVIEQLEALRSSSDRHWQNIRLGAEKATRSLRRAIADAHGRFAN